MEATIVGARGYLGRELVRLLHGHPETNVTPVSQSVAGQSYGKHVTSMKHTNLTFADSSAARDADVIFTATPKDAAKPFVALANETGATVIDLSRDYRLQGMQEGPWHYALADWNPPQKGAKRVANPGCYPTAALLATLPAQAHIEGPVIVDGKSGVSGAGVQARDDLHFPAMQGSTRAYAIEGHDHQEEMAHRLGQPLRFTPHLVPQSRGLLTTVYARTTASKEEVQASYQYGSPFVHMVDEPDTAVVAHSNHAHVAAHVDEENQLLVARCAIDNLIKGGAGQAVQNYNHVMGWESDLGLQQTGGGV